MAGPLDGLELLAPVPRPGKVVAIGRNYREHVAEEQSRPTAGAARLREVPERVIGDGAEIRWDPALTQQVDWEAELGVVIGSTARDVPVEDALDHVLGYTCLNDVSARDLQFGDGQWVRGKSLDTFCPMGPAIVTADEIGDPQGLAISCTVDGEVVQSSTTAHMYFGVAELISYCSRSFTPRARRRDRHRHARRRRRLPRPAAVPAATARRSSSRSSGSGGW